MAARTGESKMVGVGGEGGVCVRVQRRMYVSESVSKWLTEISVLGRGERKRGGLAGRLGRVRRMLVCFLYYAPSFLLLLPPPSPILTFFLL